MLTPAHKFTAMRGDVELTAEVSPCCFMYGSPLQITVRLPNGGGDTIVQNKDIAIKDATEGDCKSLLETVQIMPCKTCQKPAFDPSSCRTNRDGECEHCFMKKLNEEFDGFEKKYQAKLKKDDAKYKAKGCTHRITTWVHPTRGDDYQIIMWMTNPTAEEIVAQLKKKRGADTTGYQLVAL